MFFMKILIILLAAVVVFSEEEKTFNLKIGFDLTNGENGMPALRIRDFEESAQHAAPGTKETRKKTSEKEVVDDKKVKGKSTEKDTIKGNQSAVVRAEDTSKSKSSNSKSSEEPDEKPKIREGAAVKSSETTPETKIEKHKGGGGGGGGGKSSNTASKSRESIDEDSDAKALKHITKGMANPEEYEPEEKDPKVHGKDDDDDTRRSRRFKRQAFMLKKRHRGKKFSSSSKKITTKYRRSIV